MKKKVSQVTIFGKRRAPNDVIVVRITGRLADNFEVGSNGFKIKMRVDVMEEVLRQFTGKKIDVICGSGVALRGEVIDVKGGVLHLRDEDGKAAYIATDKIAAVYECSDAASRPGFVG